MTEYKRNNNPIDKSFLTGAIIGAAAGVVATLFLSPESGEKNRKTLKKNMKKLGDNVDKLQKMMAEEGMDIQEEIKQTASKVAQNIEDEAKKNINSAAKQVAEKSQEVVDATEESAGTQAKASDSAKDTRRTRSSRKPKFFKGV